MSEREWDERLMMAALGLARRALGQAAPNPAVAALVVDETAPMPRILARGVTGKRGRPHAEAAALDQAGSEARGRTLYVTLEPCGARSVKAFGPACADRILASGIARVVIGAEDPSPFAAGQALERLRAAGIEVATGICAAKARALNSGHILCVRAGRPFFQIKIAQSADGFSAPQDRRPIPITGEETRAFVHRVRSEADAILTGIGTILTDDPALDVRLPGMAGTSPLRIIADTSARLAADARILRAGGDRGVLVATASPENLDRRLAGRVEVLQLPIAARAPDPARLDLAALAQALRERGLTRILVEAGPELSEALAAAGLCDELILLTGPAALGTGLPALGPALQAFAEEARLSSRFAIEADRVEIFRRIPVDEEVG